jgi:serine protease Do
VMMDTLLANPLTHKNLGPYSVPVRESEQVRCWGNSDTKGEKTYNTDQINCRMESAIYVSDDLQTGNISIHHKFTQTDTLNSLRFARLMGKFFSNRVDSNTKDEDVTTSRCTEEFISNNDFNSRAVVCVEAYQKFAGLYNFLLFTNSTDEPLMNLQSRLVINGTSYENGQKFMSQFLKGLSKDNHKEQANKEKSAVAKKTVEQAATTSSSSTTKEAK